jgi:hypothetical protein
MTTAFTGDLGLIGLFDLGQLLMLNGATGVLAVTSPEGHKGYLFFDGGQIINAIDESRQEGEAAAYRLFGWKAGRFEFRPEPPTALRTIHEGTEGLMMEAARRLDEANAAQGGAGETEKLRERQTQFEALREAFQSVARDARFATGADAVQAPGGVPLAMLCDPADRLLYRVGEAPRLLHGGRWRALGDEPLDAAAYDQLKTRLLDGTRPQPGITAPLRLVRDEDGRAFLVGVLSARREAGGEALWIRAAHLDPESAQLAGAMERLHELADLPSGLLLVSAPTSESCDRLFHAVVALLAKRRGQTMLLAAEGEAWRHRDGTGVLVRCTHDAASALLHALQPEVAAFDPSHDGTAVEALHVASMVVAAQVAPNPSAALPRWLARHGLPGAALGELLCGTSLGLVYGLPAGADSRQSFDAVRWSAAGADARPTAASTPEAAAPARPAAPKPVRARSEPARVESESKPSPASSLPENDPMRALAEELGRQLRRSA